MTIRHALATAIVLATTACAAPQEEDTEGANGALDTSPSETSKPKSKVETFADALVDAEASDFGKDVASKAKPYLDEVLAYVNANLDPEAEVHSFRIPNDRDQDKFYVVDISGANGQLLFYVYRASKFEAPSWATTGTPTPFARCDTLDKVLKCSAASGASSIYEPTSE